MNGNAGHLLQASGDMSCRLGTLSHAAGHAKAAFTELLPMVDDALAMQLASDRTFRGLRGPLLATSQVPSLYAVVRVHASDWLLPHCEQG